MYSSFKLRVQNNGFFSGYINATRGVHQGGPASNAIFLCVAEMLALMLRQDTHIHGIFIKNIIHFLNQFADDMDLMLKNSQSSLDRVLQHITRFHDSTGFTLSYEKTSIYRVGAMKRSSAKLYTQPDVKWADNINVLGIHICSEMEELMETNYGRLIEKTLRITEDWGHRNISLLGKINIVNTLIASLFVYKLSVLPTPPSKIIKTFDTIIQKFLWNGHKPKISMDVLQSSKEDGGAKLVDIVVKDASLKAAWVKTLLCDQYPQDMVYEILGVKLKPECMLWCCNLHQSDVDLVVQPSRNKFWKDVLRSWCKYHYRERPEETEEDEIIWLNSQIRSDRKPICWEQCSKQGLLYVSQLIRNGSYITYDDAKTKFGVSLMQYNILKSAIPRQVKEHVCKRNDPVFRDPRFAKYMAHDKTSAYVYGQLISGHQAIINRLVEKWRKQVPEEIDAEMLIKCFNQIKLTTKVMKHRSFQYRLLHGAIITNRELCRWKIKESDVCTFCASSCENYIHLFLECPRVSPVWAKAKTTAKLLNPDDGFAITFSNIIFDRVSEDPRSINNFICLICKQYIYRQRCLQKDLCASEFERLVFENKNIEKYYAVKNNKLKSFYNRWEKAMLCNSSTQTLLEQLTDMDMPQV